MQLKVQYYALMREQAGRSEETVETSARLQVTSIRNCRRATVSRCPRAIEGRGQQRVRALVAEARRGRCRGIHTAGGGRLMRFRFCQHPIDTESARRELADGGAGGYVSFEGWVRDFNEGGSHAAGIRSVPGARGEGRRAHPGEAAVRFPIKHVLCIHRVGSLALADMAVWVGVSAAHRGEAFDACRFIIDEVKHRVPIWKKEHYRNGDSGWVNCERCAAAPHAHDHAHDAA